MKQLIFLLGFLSSFAHAGPPIIWGSPYPLVLAAGIRMNLSDTTTACNAAASGSIRYNAGTFQGCNGSAWSSLGGGGSGTVTSVATGTGLSGGPITTAGTVSLANTAVTAGSYTRANITVDAQGRLTSAANGTGGSSGAAGLLQWSDGAGGFSSSTALKWIDAQGMWQLGDWMTVTTNAHEADIKFNNYNSGGDKYLNAGATASVMTMDTTGLHYYMTNTSGTAGNPITFVNTYNMDNTGLVQMKAYGAGCLQTDVSGNVTAVGGSCGGGGFSNPVPNNTSLDWLNSSAVSKSMVILDSGDTAQFAGGTALDNIYLGRFIGSSNDASAYVNIETGATAGLGGSGYAEIGAQGPSSELDLVGNEIWLYTLGSAKPPAKLRFWDTNGAKSIDLRAPTTVTATRTLILPDGVGTAGQVLTTDGANPATTSWTSAGTSAPSHFIFSNSINPNNGSGAGPALLVDSAQADPAVYFGSSDMPTAAYAGNMPSTYLLGGDITDSTSTGNGSAIRINAGSNAGDGNPGTVIITGGNLSKSGNGANGGLISILAGNAAAGAGGNGGEADLVAGTAAGTGTGGQVFVTAGNSVSGVGGGVQITAGLGSPNGNVVLTAGGNGAGVIVNGHALSQSPTPTVSSCGGGSPAVAGSDSSGRITVGSVTSTCTLTFGNTWTTAPVCIVQDESASVLLTPAPTTSTLVITGVGIGGNSIAYHCIGY